MPRTAFITGVLGQDGSLLAESLAAQGYRVVGIARPGRGTGAPPPPGISLAPTDLGDATAVRELIEAWAPDEIYHLAAFHHASQDGLSSAAVAGKQAMLATNFLAIKTLAFALAELGSSCHLVYAASSQMYTARGDTTPIDERSPRQPPTFYGHTKSWGADLLAFMRSESGVKASTAILFNHESPRRGAQFVSRKITLAAAAAARGQRPALELYNLATRVDWSSAFDVVQALSLMGRSPAPQDFVVASGVLHSVRNMLDVAFGHVGLNWREFTSAREDQPAPALVGQPAALEQALGWRRSLSFEKMVTDMVDHDLALAATTATPA